MRIDNGRHNYLNTISKSGSKNKYITAINKKTITKVIVMNTVQTNPARLKYIIS